MDEEFDLLIVGANNVAHIVRDDGVGAKALKYYSRKGDLSVDRQDDIASPWQIYENIV